MSTKYRFVARPPRSYPKRRCVVNLYSFRHNLKNIRTGAAAGPGGMRGKHLISLAEVLDESQLKRLKYFCLKYLHTSLPSWFYKVYGAVTTAPLFKSAQQDSEKLRPVGILDPLVRFLNHEVATANKEAAVNYLEPVQLGCSKAGAHKLVTAVRSMSEQNKGFVLIKLEIKNIHSQLSRSAVVKELSSIPSLKHLAQYSAATLTSNTVLVSRGSIWGEEGDGEMQGNPMAGLRFSVSLQKDLLFLNNEVAEH